MSADDEDRTLVKHNTTLDFILYKETVNYPEGAF